MKFQKIIILFLVVLTGCVTRKEIISVKKIPSGKRIVLSYDKVDNKFLRIQIPIKFELKSKYKNDIYIYSVSYKYASNKKGLVSPYYETVNNIDVKQSFSLKKEIKYETTYFFSIYSQHLINNDSLSQLKLSRYKNMMRSKFDSVMDAKKFKEKNEDYYKYILKNDSIRIKYKVEGRMKVLKIPVL
ncbi:hypothetical protein [Tenacibaculum mesophilum]|uniref:hypothetical protein n=1 Tax=Tenacibaculum mesophilum TaxID=104268 RepID=UPI00064B32AC|nr:hypothetical protein [Tenacibaculum mesophilum]